MRTIKFRGKRVDTGEWVYGNLVHTTSVLNGTKTHHVLIGMDLELYEVHPETVGQFTGLHDKDGNEIYEGDVIKHTISINLYDGKGENERVINSYVKWSEFRSSFALQMNRHFNSDLYKYVQKELDHLAIYKNNDGVVIGNIHDNHELIKEGDK